MELVIQHGEKYTPYFAFSQLQCFLVDEALLTYQHHEASLTQRDVLPNLAYKVVITTTIQDQAR